MTDERPRAVTLVNREPGGRSQAYIDKELLAQITVAELREQLSEVGVTGDLAEAVIDGLRPALIDGDAAGHA